MGVSPSPGRGGGGDRDRPLPPPPPGEMSTEPKAQKNYSALGELPFNRKEFGYRRRELMKQI